MKVLYYVLAMSCLCIEGSGHGHVSDAHAVPKEFCSTWNRISSHPDLESYRAWRAGVVVTLRKARICLKTSRSSAECLKYLEHVRGGSDLRAEIEAKMREERAQVAEQERKMQEIQERKRKEREQATQLALITRDEDEEEEEEYQRLTFKRRRQLPEVLTLDNIMQFANECLKDGDVDEAIESYHKLLTVDPTDYTSLLQLAVIYEDIRHNVVVAEEFLDRATESEPDRPEAWKRLGWLNVQRRSETNVYGAYDESLVERRDEACVDCFSRAVNLAPADPEALMGYGSALCFVKKDINGAQEVYSRAVQSNPNNREAAICFARFLEDAKQDYGGANILYRRALQLAPGDNGCLFDYAIFLRDRRDDSASALKILKRLMIREPECSKYLKGAAETYVMDGNLEEAEAVYVTSLRANPNNAEILYEYGKFVQDCKNDSNTSKNYFVAAISVDPSHSSALYELGVKMQDEDWETAENLFGRAVTADPENSHATNALARIFLERRKDARMAEKYYNRAADGFPFLPEFQFEFACFLENVRSDLVGAEVMYLRTLQLDPVHVKALMHLGNIQWLYRNDTEEAEEYYRKALALEPQNPGVLNNLGLVLHHKALREHANITKETYHQVKQTCEGLCQEAEKNFKLAVSLEPNHVASLTSYGFFLAQVWGNDTEAEEMLGRALTLQPHSVDTMSNLAVVHCSNGLLRKAEEILLQAISLAPSHTASDKNLRFVRRLIDKQRIHQLTQRHRLQYPMAQYPVADGRTNPVPNVPLPQTPQPQATPFVPSPGILQPGAAAPGKSQQSWQLADDVAMAKARVLNESRRVTDFPGRSWNVKQEYEDLTRSSMRQDKRREEEAQGVSEEDL
ncbi:hypothetical protein GUITHDRAFT_107079 [Guillardia theta CCMP2712]|uniref:Uncharacterized protein n=2 Tax=Guillardia theta TaxID=55529 RepID=L1JG98_GUITC|nr:hypothetical protein GUITHDRAFT_107079 [Guillardia theta CCMP2712]EKX47169.1 hypothetical protein GUITHDRAFT_107079 [Guillardia theta CCMP2712]|eukprot:XP_005834149.1 hypothetical protein GUITHDRAFT_107079 [Guillardia theta CCMP2712]